jgi:hypothetical protein
MRTRQGRTPASVLVPDVSEFTDRHALQVKAHTLADLTDSRTGQPGLFFVESSITVWQRFNRGVDELVHR